MGRQGLGLSAGGLRVVPVDALPSDASTYGPLVLYQKHPTLEKLPATVVNGARLVLEGSPRVEYLGVGGVWTAQPSVTVCAWQAGGGLWSPLCQDPDELCVIPIKAGGNGSAVATLILTSEVNCVAFIDGAARFYTDSGGTTGESTSTTLTANVAKNIYIRLASGTSRIFVEKCNRISSFGGFMAFTNSPTLNKFNTYYTRNMKNIYLVGELLLVGGITYQWANVTKDLLFIGGQMSVSGSTYPWASVTDNIYFIGNSFSIRGSTYPWTSVTKNIYFDGSSFTIRGNTYPWANITQSIVLIGSSLAANWPTSITTGEKYNRWYFRPAVGSMPSADVDRALIDLAATWTTPSGASPTFDARGNCGARTAASDAAVATLTGRGITVLTN